MTVAYLGDKNSYSYRAAAAFMPEENLAGFVTLSEVLDALVLGKADYAAVPVENSIEGAITETLDFLFSQNAYIVSETSVTVNHKLIGQQGAKLEDIKEIYSHYQALAQCRGFINKLKSVAVQSTPSTSAALQRITAPHIAAIAQTAAAGQTVLKEGISDYDTNITRFWLLSQKPKLSGNTVSVVFTTPNQSGALINVLSVIAGLNINMTRIQSRPGKVTGATYNFFVDFDFSGGTDKLSESLDKIGRACKNLKFLGRY